MSSNFRFIRTNSSNPNSCSNALICWEMADWEIWHSSAASVKLLQRTTAWKYLTWFSIPHSIQCRLMWNLFSCPCQTASFRPCGSNRWSDSLPCPYSPFLIVINHDNSVPNVCNRLQLYYNKKYNLNQFKFQGFLISISYANLKNSPYNLKITSLVCCPVQN